MPSNLDIARQIEQSADYYLPSTYSGGGSPAVSYLTFYNEIAFTADGLGEQFYPLSAVAQQGRNPKMFVVGIIPPSANVTGIVLDRSASINSVAPQEPQYANIQTPSGNVEIVNSVASTAAKEQVPNKLTRLNEGQVREAFIEGFTQVTGQRPTEQVLALLMAQSSLETGGWKSLHNYNFGNIKGTNWPHQTTTFGAWEVIDGQRQDFPAGHPQTIFRAYQTPAEGAADYVLVLLRDNPRRNPPDAWKQALLNGDPQAFATVLREPPPYYTGNRELYAKAVTRLYDQYFQIEAVPADGYDGNWKKNGSPNADAARQIQDKTANTPLVDVTVKRFTDAQRAQILDIQNSLTAMANIPPLRMLVNPSSFSVSGEKIVSESGWTRNGNTIIEHWGNQQEKISASGKVAGFYAMDLANATGPGLTRAARNYSQGWQNFQSLFMLYKNNGGLFVKDQSASDRGQNLSLVGSVYIYYDSIMYVGSFDSFRISEVDTAPHTVEYSFEFTVRAAFLLDNPNPEGSVRSQTTINSQNVNALFG